MLPCSLLVFTADHYYMQDRCTKEAEVISWQGQFLCSCSDGIASLHGLPVPDKHEA